MHFKLFQELDCLMLLMDGVDQDSLTLNQETF